MEFLVQRMRIIRSESSPDLFLLRPIVRSQAAFSAAAHPGGARKPHERIELASWAGLTHRQDFVPVFVTAENLDPSLFYNADFDSAIIFEAFRVLLRPERPPEVGFADVRQQWGLLSERQFLNNAPLRNRIGDLEADIRLHSGKFEKFRNPAWVKGIVFEVILTYSLYNWDGTRELDGMIDLLLPFVEAYVLQYGEGDESCASQVFDVFSVFYERNGFCEIRASHAAAIPPRLRERIESMFGELLQILTQKHITSLDFLADDCSRWFVDLFGEDAKILWISILAFGDTEQFFESFLIALLLMLMPDLNELIPLSSQEFVDRFNEVKVGARADLRTLLVNTREIHAMCHPT